MSRSALLFLPLAASLLLPGCIVIPVGDLLKGPALEEQVLSEGQGLFSRDKIAILEIDGVISGDESTGLIGGHANSVSEVKARLNRMRADSDVQGVLLRISSPGGEVTACDTIHHEILEFKKATKMPVVACIVDEGASGGYYIASAADTIYASPTAIVGSIGVIMQTFDLHGLLGKIGVDTLAIKSADKKDLTSIFRARTDEENAILQKVVDDMFKRFVDAVAAREGGPPREEVLKVADGRILSAPDALQARLVDKIGYLPEAMEDLRKRAKIERRPEIIRYTRLARSGSNLYSLAGLPAASGGEGGSGISISLRPEALPRTRFLYLWQP
jgi:protease-4